MSDTIKNTATPNAPENAVVLVDELANAADALNKVIGKRTISELSDIMFSYLKSDAAVELGQSIIADEMSSHGVFASFVRADGLIARIRTQIVRESV